MYCLYVHQIVLYSPLFHTLAPHQFQRTRGVIYYAQKIIHKYVLYITSYWHLKRVVLDTPINAAISLHVNDREARYSI